MLPCRLLVRVLILGGDGYLGWPTAMRFSERGHEVSVVDNFSRRRWHAHRARFAASDPLAGGADCAWKEVSGKEIVSHDGAIEDAEFLEGVVVTETKPEAIVHYGEQPSAPYSMASREHAVETQYANVIGNLNLFFAMRDTSRTPTWSSSGRWGYGTPNIDIEEGYIEIEHKGRKDTSRSRSSPARSITSPRSTTPTTSTSPAASGACARPTSTRASSTGSRRRRPPGTSASSPVSTTTRPSAPCSTASASRPWSAARSRSTARAARPAASSTSATRSSASSWPSRTPPTPASSASSTSSPSSSRSSELAELVKAAAAELGIEVEVEHLANPRVEVEEHYYNATHTKLLDLGPTRRGSARSWSVDDEDDRGHKDRIDPLIEPTRLEARPQTEAGVTKHARSPHRFRPL